MAEAKENGAPEEASIGHVKRIIRLKKRRHSEHEENHLNIYPMLDIMMIILVFMIMQFTSSSASKIQESPELKIPVSSSDVDMKDAMAIQISRNELALDGERVIELRDGNVEPGNKQGGGNGFLITALLKKLKNIVEVQKAIAKRNPQAEFKGSVLVIADKRTPYRTLTEVLYTLGQAEFDKLKFVVNRKSAK